MGCTDGDAFRRHAGGLHGGHALSGGDFLMMENHSVHIPGGGDLVEGIEKPIVSRGFIAVRGKPGSWASPSRIQTARSPLQRPH